MDANQTLYSEMAEQLSRCPVISKGWIRSRVGQSNDRAELQQLLDSPRTPDYVRMSAFDRIKSL